MGVSDPRSVLSLLTIVADLLCSRGYCWRGACLVIWSSSPQYWVHASASDREVLDCFDHSVLTAALCRSPLVSESLFQSRWEVLDLLQALPRPWEVRSTARVPPSLGATLWSHAAYDEAPPLASQAPQATPRKAHQITNSTKSSCASPYLSVWVFLSRPLLPEFHLRGHREVTDI